MDAYLSGGPADGKIISHPRLHLYRHPVPIPLDSLTINDALQGAFNPAIAKPSFNIADYEFTGYAAVGLDGNVRFVIYKYKEMEPYA